jgi:hypothetical protein
MRITTKELLPGDMLIYFAKGETPRHPFNECRMFLIIQKGPLEMNSVYYTITYMIVGRLDGARLINAVTYDEDWWDPDYWEHVRA